MVDAIPLRHCEHSEAPEGLGFWARRLRVAFTQDGHTRNHSSFMPLLLTTPWASYSVRELYTESLQLGPWMGPTDET